MFLNGRMVSFASATVCDRVVLPRQGDGAPQNEAFDTSRNTQVQVEMRRVRQLAAPVERGFDPSRSTAAEQQRPLSTKSIIYSEHD
jgi:hypothetical protein